jgi:hypothetical protein
MLTAANAVITITQATLFPTPQQLQGFSADDVTDMDPVKILEHLMGVDGVLSFGFVWVPRMQNITLQGDSDSCSVFDTISTQQEAGNTAYPLTGLIILPAIPLQFTCINGALETYNPMPPVRRIIQPRKFGIVWNKVIPQPVG